MVSIRETKIFKYFWVLMALHFINGSVDPVDLRNLSAREDLSLNEMESISEIIAEQILDIEDCFPEHDEPFEDGNTPIEQVKHLSQFLPTLNNLAVVFSDESGLQLLTSYSRRLNTQFSPEISLPPPEFLV